MILILVAGIDTTWSAIGASIWHLAQNPDDLARLVNEPDLMPTAMQFARRIAEKDSYTLRVHKELFNRTEYMGIVESHSLVMDYSRKLPGIPHQSG